MECIGQKIVVFGDLIIFFLTLRRPDLIDWRNIRNRVVRERLETAFHVAEKEYGVTRLLDPEGEPHRLFVTK